MITIKEHINNLVKFNAKHIAELKSEEEVKDWLISLLWSVVGFKHFKQSISDEELDRLALDYVGERYGYYYQDIDDIPDHLVVEVETFKAGYKKAKEEEI